MSMEFTSRPLLRTAGLFCAAVLLAACEAARDQPAAPAIPVAPLADRDSQFLAAQLEAGLAEITLAELAKEKATRNSVRAFAEQMVADHTVMHDQLTAIARRKGITAPATADTAQEQARRTLNGLSGNDFDSAYMQMEVRARDNALKEFLAQSQQGSDSDLRFFAQQYKPMIEHHADLARLIAAWP
jgi:putative membrane protein